MPAETPADGEVLEVAHQLGRQVVDASFLRSDGSRTWGRGFDLALRPTEDAGIFNGRSGDALFLSFLYHATREPEFRQAALEALEGIRKGLSSRTYAEDLLRGIGAGLAGMGSILYALVRCAEFLGEPALIADAARAVLDFRPEKSHEPRKDDIFWGAAAAVLGLLAVAGTGNDAALANAIAFGDSILEHRVIDRASGFRAWGTTSDTPQVGFAHGSSGIAHALLTLHRHTMDSRYRDAALEAFAFERALYREDVSDWPNTRSQPSDHVHPRWCHGAVGVGLSRLFALSSCVAEEADTVAADLRRTLTRAATAPRSGPDNLCCGALGRIDLLVEAGVQLENEPLRALARHRAAGIVRHLRTHGYHSLAADERTAVGPGLWQGLSGIGYTLLRLEAPRVYPCVIALA